MLSEGPQFPEKPNSATASYQLNLWAQPTLIEFRGWPRSLKRDDGAGWPAAGLAYGNRLSAPRAPDGLNDFGWQAKTHVLRHNFNFFDAREAVLAQIIHHVLDQDLGGGRAGRHRDRIDALEPGRIDRLRVVDQVAHGPKIAGNLDQPVGVGTVGGTDHQDQSRIVRHVAHRNLAVLGGVADVLRMRADDVGK